MRLAAFRESMKEDKLFQLTVLLASSLLGILTVATRKDDLIWQRNRLNEFSAKFFGLKLIWNQPDDLPMFLYIDIGGENTIEDNGSGTYGFAELSDAIYTQQDRLKNLKTRSAGPTRTHPYKHPYRSD